MDAESPYKSPGLLKMLSTRQTKDHTYVSELADTVSSKHGPTGVIVELFSSVDRLKWLLYTNS